MNKLIKQIIYYTHDKWKVEIKYKNETIHFLEFALQHRRKDSEFLLKDILQRIDKGGILPAKGLLLEFNKYMPELMHDYILLFDNSNLIKRYKQDLK